MDNSPLAKLPAELRASIYEFALASPTPITLSSQNGRSGSKLQRRRRLQSPSAHMALTRTCRQIYRETGHLFFSLNTFEFRDTCLVSLSTVIKNAFMRMPQAWHSVLRHVEVRLWPSICFCHCCSHRTSNLRRKLRAFFDALNEQNRLHPACDFTVRSAFCYSPTEDLELVVGNDSKSWEKAIEFAGDERHARRALDGLVRQDFKRIQRSAQYMLRDLQGRNVGFPGPEVE